MRHVLAVGVVLAVAVSTSAAFADVTVKGLTTGKGLGQLAEGETTTYIKGLRMRSDQMRGDEQMTTIIDVDGQKMISINHKKKEAEIINMADLSETLKKISESDIKASLTPTGQSRTIAGISCDEHQISIAVDAAPTPELKMTMVMSGPACLAKTAPGRETYSAFYRAAVERGLFFGDPRQAKAQPGQAKGMSTLYEKLAAAGVPLSQDIQIRFEGSGPMAAMMSKMGATSMSFTVSTISAAPVDESVFAIPAGYKTKSR